MPVQGLVSQDAVGEAGKLLADGGATLAQEAHRYLQKGSMDGGNGMAETACQGLDSGKGRMWR